MIEENQKKELLLIEDLGRLYPTEKPIRKERFGIYKCYCGNEFKAMTSHIKSGNSTSCGCYRKQALVQRKTTHGLGKHRLYKVWTAMIQRCNNKNNPAYENYGGRGITVCDRWLDINNFIEDMYQTFQDGLTIDRINNDKGYNPDNCRWENYTVQCRNTRILKSTNTSGYRGVSFHKMTNKFSAKIRINGKDKHLGLFCTELDGAKAYDKYVIDNNLEHTINGVL